jgi:molybdopterin converting factor small subunit
MTLPEGTALIDLVMHLGIDQQLGYDAAGVTTQAGWQVIVNGRARQDMSHPLQDGDQVHIFPPMAGG